MAIANNPFDLNTASGADLLGKALGGISAPQSTGYTAATAGGTGFTTSDANPFGYTASTMTGQGYNAGSRTGQGYNAGSRTGQGYEADKAGLSNWNVLNNQTVQGQIGGIIASNSPLLQQARANSLAQMNSRGLVNSSMALGEGEKAVFSAALPIATQDAATDANAAQLNANAANQLAQFNSGQVNQGLGFSANAANQAGSENLAASNQALGFTAGAANQAGSENLAASNQALGFTSTAANQAAAQNQAAKNQAMQANAAAASQASLANAAAFNQAAQFTAGATNQAALTNAAAQNQAAQFSAAGQTDVSKQYATALNSTVQNMMDQSMKYALSNADAQTKIELQNIDASTRAALAATEATYKNQMQASASSIELFQQTTKNIADLMANGDLSPFATTDGAAPKADGSNLPAGTKVVNGVVTGSDNVALVSPKQAAVNSQKDNLDSAFAILSLTSGVAGLKDLLVKEPVVKK